jgi:hypothetical protein
MSTRPGWTEPTTEPMATMTADANNAGATGTALLTLWKVGRVELPRITKVYRDALAGLGSTKNADVAGPGEVFALWVKVRGELRRVVVLSARRTEAAGDAVCRAIAEYTGADADGRKSSAVAGQELWRKINDPREVDPEDPEQNPPPAPPRATAREVPYVRNVGAGGAAASAATPDYLAELATKAEAVKHLAIAKKKNDAKAFGDWIDDQFRAYTDKLDTAYAEWAEAYEQWKKQRPRHGADGPPAPGKPLQLDRIATSELKAAYDKEVESSYEWIVPAFREWAASDPEVFTEHIAAIRGVEGRLGDGEALRLATSAQINLASGWDGAYCTNLRNFLGTLLVVRANQQAVARTLRELLEAEQALYRQAQGDILRLADNVRLAIEGIGEQGKPEHRTHLTILSAVTWIAGAALAIPSGGASLYAGVVTLNAIAAVSSAAASLLPAGSAKSLSADTVDGVLEKMSEVMAQARSDLAEREKDITSALQHNLEALASLRRQAEDAKVNSPVVPAQPTLVDAAPGHISSRLHPR